MKDRGREGGWRVRGEREVVGEEREVVGWGGKGGWERWWVVGSLGGGVGSVQGRRGRGGSSGEERVEVG